MVLMVDGVNARILVLVPFGDYLLWEFRGFQRYSILYTSTAV
jgi:hypothetical protein